MFQPTLHFGAQHHGEEAWVAQLEILRAAVSHLGAKEVLDQLDINRSTLSECLNPRPREKVDDRYERRWAAQWTHTVKSMLAARHGDPVAYDLLKRLCMADMVATPFVVDEPDDMTPEEEAALEHLLEKRRRRKAKK